MENERTRVEQLVISRNLNTSSMYNKERKLQFIQDIYGKYNDVTDNTLKSIVQLFNQFGKYENQLDKNDKDLLNMEKSEFIKFFEYFRWSGNSVLQKKSIVKSYLNWGYDKKLIKYDIVRYLEGVGNNDVNKKRVFNNYFKNFPDLQNTLTLILSRKSISQKEENKIQFMTVKISVYLAWFGVKLKDICEIKKNQIDKEQNRIYIESENYYINIPENIMQEIIEYRDFEGYRTKEEIEQTLGDSDMLMKSTRSAKLASTNISTLISKILNGEENDYKQFSYQKIYWSGIYYNAHIYEQEKQKNFRPSDTEVLAGIFHEKYNSVSRASIRLADYRDYCACVLGEHHH